MKISITGNKRRRTLRSGFSLIEILIVMTLFSIAAVILSQIFVSFNRQHRKVANEAVLAQDMRFAMEFAIRESRNKLIDYSAYPTELEAASSTNLWLTSSAGSEGIGVVPGATCGDLTVTSCLALTKDGGATWTPITSKHTNVRFFGVYVRPTTSPFILSGGSYTSNIQPMATLNLSLEYVASNPKDNVTLQAQTTVSSRVYVR